MSHTNFPYDTAHTQCSSFRLTAKTSNPFGNAESVGGQSVGSIPFGSGSSVNYCTNSGPGEGKNFGGTGIHCWDNINDDIDGNDNSWVMTTAYSVSGKYFAGIRFARTQNVSGIRISRNALAPATDPSDRFSADINVYITRPSTVPFPTHTTVPSLWQCIGVIPPRADKGYFWYGFPVIYDASGIILEPTNPESEASWQCIEELKVYGVSTSMHFCT
jgi:hypothetical protein